MVTLRDRIQHKLYSALFPTAPYSLLPTPCSLFPTYHQIPQGINTTAHIL
ncbi:hypothetical protein [Moorena sp. SIO3I6]|nr:hypothetical protein [Moorena sp. SIO3I6]NEP27019.1 hypothetical protein [Moorena sp. SIO3I6]